MGLDKSLFSFENYKSLLTEIDNFLNGHLSDTFISINPPKLIFSTRSKHDYIVSRKKLKAMAELNDLTWEADNIFIPKYIPGDLKWYKKDGLDTWYLRNKCEDFLKNTDLHFAKRKVVNVLMIKNEVGEETKKQYQTIDHEEIKWYPVEQKRHVC